MNGQNGTYVQNLSLTLCHTSGTGCRERTPALIRPISSKKVFFAKGPTIFCYILDFWNLSVF